MVTHDAPRGGQARLGPTFAESIPVALLDTPLDYILVDHFRQRSLCATLRRLAGAGSVDRPEADMIVDYLRRDLPLHHRDEEEDLFPRLRRRLLPEDELEPALIRLVDEHRRFQPTVDAIMTQLAARSAEAPVALGRAACKSMLAYATGEHRHLAAENGIVLAIARIRLTRGDLAKMSRSMKQRRGLPA
jgi:hemerythrin-like domain-containing protein